MGHHDFFSRNRRRLGSTALALSLTGLTAFGGLCPAIAASATLPDGGRVVLGSATITQQGPTSLEIDTGSARTAINWQSFSIAAGHTVTINQPNASSLTLNQVVGPDPSQIFGSLKSNGQVVLANPNGIWFGPGSHVDVASIVASTATASQASLQAFARGGALMLDKAGKASASIVNDGAISIGDEGLAGLVAPGVANNGIIAARLGRVVLASGTVATLDFYGDGLISFAVGGSVTAVAKDQAGKNLNAAVVNSGTISNAGGTVLMTAASAKTVVDNTINMSGVVVASAVSAKGGEIDLDGGSGTTSVSGELRASSKTSTGGTINVTGHSIVLAPTARLDVTGAAGGSVVVGGGMHGSGTLAHATDVTLAKGSTIAADGTAGAGGTVAVWSDGVTKAGAAITATGMTVGGAVETSGHDLDIAGVSVKAGSWLLDPISLELTPTDQASISAALNAGTSVTVATSASANPTGGFGATLPGNANGDIVVDGDTTGISWTTNASLTLNAYGTVALSNGARIVTTGIGTITLTGGSGVLLGPGAALATASASIATSAAAVSAIPATAAGAVTLAASSIDLSGNVATSGNINISGEVTLDDDVTVTAASATFAGTIDGPHAVTIYGDADFEGIVGGNPYVYHPINSSPTSLVVTGTTVIDTATITTDGSQEYHGAVTLKTSTNLSTGENDITFDSTIDDGNAAGTDGLGLGVGIGVATLRGPVGDIAPLASLFIGGTSVLPERVTTIGTQTYGAAMTLIADTTLAGSGLSPWIVNGGTHRLTLDAGAGGVALATVTLGSLQVNSSGPLVLYAGSTYAVGSSLSLGPVTIYGSVEFDQPTSLGAVTLASTYYGDPNSVGGPTIITAQEGITFTSTVDGANPLTIFGDAVFDGIVGGISRPTSLLVSGSSTIATSAITTNSTLDLRGPITLLSDTILAGSQLTLGQVAGGIHGLTVNAGQGAVTLNGIVDSGLTLNAASVTLDSGTYTIGTAPLVLGDVSLSGDLHFGQAASFDKIVLVGSTDLTGPTFTFNGTIDGADSQFIENEMNGYSSTVRVGDESLAIFGSAIFNAGVGTATLLQGLRVAGDATINTDAITVSGSQAFQGSVTLSRDVGLTGSSIVFTGTVDGVNGLSIIGDASFGDIVGGTAPLAALDISGTATVTRNAFSLSAIGAQSFHGAVIAGGNALTLTSDSGRISLAGVTAGGLTLNTPNPVLLRSGTYTIGSDPYSFGTVEASGNITLGQATSFGRFTADGANLVGPSLTFRDAVDGPSFLSVEGNAEFDGPIGRVEALTFFETFGTTAIDTPLITATQAQQYWGPVRLGTDTVITGPSVTFGGTVDGAHALTLIGDAEFDGVVGGVTPLASVDVTGHTAMYTTAVTTTTTQDYQGAVSLVPVPPPYDGGGSGGFEVGGFGGAGGSLGSLTNPGVIVADATTTLSTLPLDPVLTGSSISFGGTVDGARALTINGNAIFMASVGGLAPLVSVEITGTAALRSIATTGTQTYRGATTLNGSYVASSFTAPGPIAIGGDTTINAPSGVSLGSVTSSTPVQINGQTVTPLAFRAADLTLPRSVTDPAAAIVLPVDWRLPAAGEAFDVEFLPAVNGKPGRSKKPT